MTVYRRLFLFVLLILLPPALVMAAIWPSRKAEVLVGHESVYDYFSIDRNSVTMYASAADKAAGIPECRVFSDEFDVFLKMFGIFERSELVGHYLDKGTNRFSMNLRLHVQTREPPFLKRTIGPDPPLKGLRVAIDPGHSAATIEEAKRERRFVRVKGPDGGELEFFEANLNLLTALELKKQLAKDGATVFLTRTNNGQTYPVPFEKWVKTDLRKSVKEQLKEGYITQDEAKFLLSRKADEKDLFKFFHVHYELPYRADMINAFEPDITLLIHYNTTGEMERVRNGETGKMEEQVMNYSMVFTAGCFLKSELNDVISRMEFLRMLLSTDLADSANLARYLIRNFRMYLKLPAADSISPEFCPVSGAPKGVYARNLRMTRLVHGIVVLGEPLQQNNLEEAVELVKAGGSGIPERMHLVVKCYYNAVHQFMRIWQ